jgi:hypothetical protein
MRSDAVPLPGHRAVTSLRVPASSRSGRAGRRPRTVRHRAEDAAFDGPVDFPAQAVLDLNLLDPFGQFPGRNAECFGNRRHRFHGGHIATLTPMGMIDRPGELLGLPGITFIQPPIGARRYQGIERHNLRHDQRNAQQTPETHHIMLEVISAQRLKQVGLHTRDLENRPKQHGPPYHLPTVTGSDVIDACCREISIGRSEVEIEIDRCGHRRGFLLKTLLSRQPTRPHRPRQPPLAKPVRCFSPLHRRYTRPPARSG